MKKSAVISSFIQSVGYSRKERKLTVVIKGKQYNYVGVPKSVFTAMRKADSVGQFYNEVVKPEYEVSDQ
jgi:hypothetical protein